jgi:methylenetetrahydrofolate--tRNA-(uracil-5-)-methyltransferase
MWRRHAMASPGKQNMNKKVAIIGAGLAGSEAALVLARNGIKVDLYEARPHTKTPAHTTDAPAELVCSNSFKSQELPSGHGQLKAELTILGSPLISAARANAVPAGSALAVDREKFAAYVEKRICTNPLINFIRKELVSPPDDCDYCIIAAGPLASEKLCTWLTSEFSASSMNFYDAIAPIVSAESINMEIAFTASRWDDGEGDYINCPFTEEQFQQFYNALTEADKVDARSFEKEQFFEACLPVEVIAERGYQALAYGPMRPIGLTDPHTGKRPYAVCQLRKETVAGESYNLVGFQTRLKFPEQKKVFSMIPGLENAEFLRYGSIHRNTYMDSPRILSTDLSFKQRPHLFLAGQLSGNEGYTESVATGHLAALFVSAKYFGVEIEIPPETSALGALLKHVTLSPVEPFTPSNVHFGLFPPLDTKKRICKKDKKSLLCKRASESMNCWREGLQKSCGGLIFE